MSVLGRNLGDPHALYSSTDDLRSNFTHESWTEYLAEFDEIGSGYRAIIGKHFPAMSVVQVVAVVDSRANVEIEATAVIPDQQLSDIAKF